MTPETTDFLYPFIEAEPGDPAALLVDLASSATAKAAESARLRDVTLAGAAPELDELAAEMADRFLAGGRLFTMGNGGSATDADALATLFGHPPAGPALPARSLASDEAVVTALANDVGFELVFSRQLIAYGHAGDMVVGLSTSGNSQNLIEAFAEARRRGMLSVGMAGYDGGQMARCGDLDHCFVVCAESIHRIQETQAALGLSLWEGVHARCAGGGAA